MDFILKIAVLALFVTGPVALASDKSSNKKPEFVKIDGEEGPKKSEKTTWQKIDEEEGEAKVAKDEPKEPQWNDLGGQSLTGTPRLIRQDPMTEVFFRDLRDSYVIHTDSKHNANFKVFEEAARANRPVSFRADPVSRRILAVDGVNGAKAPAAGPAPASVGSPLKAGSK